MKIGFVARADNSGLGTLSWEFARHVKPFKTIIVENGVYRVFKDRFPHGQRIYRSRNFHPEDIEWLCEGSDVIVIVETPYQRKLIDICRRFGKKIVMIPMFEAMPPDEKGVYDLYLCPSKLDYDECVEPKKLLPFPVARDRVQFRLREKANVFLHNAGHGGMASRNGTDELLKAIPLVKSQDVKFIINSQSDLKCDDPRVEVRVGNIANYWDLYNDGDVLVFPQKFAGLSLPVNEALSSGMAIMHSDIYPFNTYLPKELLIPVRDSIRAAIYRRKVSYAIMQPEDIAAKIDEWAGRDITVFSKISDELAEAISWKKLESEFIETLKNV